MRIIEENKSQVIIYQTENEGYNNHTTANLNMKTLKIR